MADVKARSRNTRIKSSERNKSGSKGDKTRRGNSQDQEEEAKESLAYKVLSEEQTTVLKELTPHELEAKLSEILNISEFHVSLTESSVLDYYVAGFWFTKEQNFNTQQSSAFFTLLKILLENVKALEWVLTAKQPLSLLIGREHIPETFLGIHGSMIVTVKYKQLSLVDNFKEFKKYLAGIGVENCSLNGGLECFDVNQAKLITDYFTDGLFQHYKLYEYLFTKEAEEEVITTELKIEIAPMASIPFPPPLDEGMTEEAWKEYIMTPPPSPQPGDEEAKTENEESQGVQLSTEQESKDMISTIQPDIIQTLVKKTTDDVFGNFKNEVEAKLKERESNYTAKLAKK